MESVEIKITHYKIKGQITNIEQKIGRRHIHGAGPDAVFAEFTEGWRITFVADNTVFSFLFREEPELKIGPATIVLQQG